MRELTKTVATVQIDYENEIGKAFQEIAMEFLLTP